MADENEAAGYHALVTLLESIEVGLVVLDLDYRVKLWNGFMENHSGVTSTRIKGQSLFEQFPELPQTTSDPIQAEKETESVVVSIDANGAYYLQVGDQGSDPMPLGQVQEMVGKIMAGRTNREVLVRGDQNVQYGKVVRLMSVLQQAGATNVGLITEAEQTDEVAGGGAT